MRFLHTADWHIGRTIRGRSRASETETALAQVVQIARDEGHDVSHIHVRYLSPFPRNLGDLLKRYDRVLVPEMNNGQLVTLLRAEYLVPAEGLNQISGKPFKISTIEAAIREQLEK